MNATSFTVDCTHCGTTFPVDPAKVPEEGVHARCSACQGVFFVERPAPEAVPSPEHTPGEAAEAVAPEAEAPLSTGSETTFDFSLDQDTEVATEAGPEPEADVETSPAPAATPRFGRQDPHEKASRLARVLVSDMISYNPDRYARALERGTLKEDFEDEVQKSWEEYVDQVGKELAEGSTYFQDALNEILARGDKLY